MEKQNTDQRRQQADRFDNVALVACAALTLCIASWRVPQMADAHAQATPVVPVVMAEQGRGQ
ncbi:hypothetical protein [Luteimonas terrae]|uniref:Energy transducer TonB n=1 Tax=Luteimonas terrae TaxID=1530191 RepID=A0ABU1XX82_9GAMM|nr:hypothetical protein [Luteimonas terrae]MDR7193379.1 hypothetical protein [Luteimonas terrae]